MARLKRTLITLSGIATLLFFFPLLAASQQYQPPGNPIFGPKTPCMDNFLIPTLGGGPVQVQPCPSVLPPAPPLPPPPPPTGGGGGGSSGRGGNRRTGSATTILNARRLITVSPAPQPPPAPVIIEEPQAPAKPLWHPPVPMRTTPPVSSPAYEPIPTPMTPTHNAAPLPHTGMPLALPLALSAGTLCIATLRKHFKNVASPL